MSDHKFKNERICGNCGQRHGKHRARDQACPDRDGDYDIAFTFEESEDRMDRICQNCGKTYGNHSGDSCPRGSAGFKAPPLPDHKKPKPKGGVTKVSKKPDITSWELDEPEQVLNLANSLYESMLVRERIPSAQRPKMILRLEVRYE